jgi:uncharacterized protein (TIGR03435 family)
LTIVDNLGIIVDVLGLVATKGDFTMRFPAGLLFTLPFALLSAQAPPTFEVATVKPNKSGTTQANVGMPPNGVNFVNLPLRGIIQLAYGINQPSKLAGVPDWAVTERYDITARAAGPITQEERRLMLQALLKDRLKLDARFEKREVSVLALMPARSDGKLGKNLVESKGCIARGGTPANDAAPAGTETRVCGPQAGGAGRLVLIGTNMQQFTSLLALMLGSVVVDKTGLTSRYDLDLTFTPERQIPEGVIPGPAADPNGPSIYTAVREQLGLKLESQKVQEEVLVIDHVERQPSEN